MAKVQRLLFTLALLPLVPQLASAAQLDRPTLASYVQGHAKIVVIVQAGTSGAPAGFELQWLKFSDFLANSGQFYETANAIQSQAVFDGVPTLNTWDGTLASFQLGGSALAAVEIGDLFDETGLTANAAARLELVKETPYIFRARAIADGVDDASEWSNVFIVESTLNVNCTFTQGYWKNHPEAWPPACLSLQLGNVVYNQAQLLAILGQPAQGNGLIILAHQLIAAMLNVCQGADNTDIVAALAAAHAAIGNLVIPPVGGDTLPPNSVSGIAQTLDDYNNGIIGPGHCGPTSQNATPWSQVKAAYR
jgi:hypothetical protein